VISLRRGFIPARPVDRRAGHSFPAYPAGAPVWLLLARREEITTPAPSLISAALSGPGSARVLVVLVAGREVPQWTQMTITITAKTTHREPK
jgi:hypothetical protein